MGKKLAQVTNIESKEVLEMPFLRIIDPDHKNSAIFKYKPEGDEYDLTIDGHAIKDFLNDFLAGRLENFLKTQKNPTTPATIQLPIRALNTETFKALLKDETDKDIFMFFGGPACFSCNAVWPEFEKLARVLHENSENLVFAFVDLTHNEL